MKLKKDGFLARCIQHEIDHLNGITFFDHLGSLKRKMIEKKYKKLMQENAKS
ncbi:peptide deformylase [Francisella tularensis]|uniref:peptide deformylase n=1 Tax=Francisella tularensis TaxID=263 RepID=UPI0021B18203|nr:peptide deformylase [Francisella tularensis]